LAVPLDDAALLLALVLETRGARLISTATAPRSSYASCSHVHEQVASTQAGVVAN
jgi:hypothetical protein